ncbi:hypothetical protein PV08_00444 [Exophiala spinifera]|uniref:Uncharacterized protein n=1 Tax=Exophiala spinifera TaxID=91928 RepID=A0A0D2C8J3_9EURO|nr:uncharacterized protein PV08_00444 [Exophiala spinifera]KIW19869.1 hypothetical protein PV08_00444 [Exophiala spinifera]
MSAPNAGRQSPDPERQSGAQQGDHPSQPGSGKIDESKAKDEGKGQDDQTFGLADNPKHILQDHSEATTSKKG